ncbi:hypothetical protein [Kitasatospora sp. A2-31]|uniref:hypothetical protein n=1 Tax=Kitasatospora sp. A2-31 TaxID=2916414 RepID=UPI001EE8E481|nr:hypothetical protein [Kitasatospora sp. A2-31]MCG6493424.1 hypothetical protein [Kitasatospora sp. A2-31]
MTTIEQLADAEARLTELQLAFVDAADDPNDRRRIATQLRETRDEITRLYELLPA